MPEVLRSTKLAIENGQSQGRYEPYEPETEICASMLDAINEYVQGKDKTSTEKRIAICVFVDVGEHCIKKLLYQLCWKHVMIQAQTSARKTEEVVVGPEKIIDPAKQEEATYTSLFWEAEKTKSDVKVICTCNTSWFMGTVIGVQVLRMVNKRENKVAGNASNKRKWKGDHNGSFSQQQNKEHKVFRAHTVRLSNKEDYAGNLPWISVPKAKQRSIVSRKKAEVIYYGCGGLGHYKSNCPIVKFQNRVDMYWKGKARGDSIAMTSDINI
ncbi:hypothetical protein Tco_0544162, partial [Tanacetum coccineum]